MACLKARDYLSEEEEEILRELRALKEELRSLRGRMKGARFGGLAGRAREGGGESPALEPGAATAEMEKLKRAWRELEARLKRANAHKLALLGHVPGEGSGPL